MPENRGKERRAAIGFGNAAFNPEHYRDTIRHMTRDHVCDMDIDESTAAATTRYAGDTYYFCSEQCKKKFEADPESYVSRTEASSS